MSGERSRRAVHWICCLALCLAATGCLGGSGVTNADARARALAAEEAHVTQRLENASCVRDWGLTGYVGIEEEATVVERTTDGVRVSVTHPYWYSTNETEGDGGSRAVYLVTPKRVQRLNGDDVTPCRSGCLRRSDTCAVSSPTAGPRPS